MFGNQMLWESEVEYFDLTVIIVVLKKQDNKCDLLLDLQLEYLPENKALKVQRIEMAL